MLDIASTYSTNHDMFKLVIAILVNWHIHTRYKLWQDSCILSCSEYMSRMCQFTRTSVTISMNGAFSEPEIFIYWNLFDAQCALLCGNCEDDITILWGNILLVSFVFWYSSFIALLDPGRRVGTSRNFGSLSWCVSIAAQLPSPLFIYDIFCEKCLA